MKRLMGWIDERTGLCTAARQWLDRPLAGGAGFRHVWISTIAFTFITQLLTGVVLWMYYSPGGQSAWESVYYLQYHVQYGWLLRAMHHYAGQVMLVLVGLYFLQMILRGSYRAPREVMFWCVVLMGLVTLGFNLTGDLLPWDQNSYWATHVRTGFLRLLPVIGDPLYRLAVGGADFGHLTLTRFVALHVGVLTAVFAGLMALHAWVARRQGMEQARDGRSEPYWPGQALRNAVACLIVLGAILLLSLHNGTSGPDIGIELGAPANPAEGFEAARPEWSFRGLFQFREMLPAHLEILAIFVIPGCLVLLVLAMPWIGKRPAGHVFNIVFVLVLLAGLAVLSKQSYSHDAKNEDYQQALAAAREQADRAKELADARGIPPGGALVLLRGDGKGDAAGGQMPADPKSRAIAIYQKTCAACHPYDDGKSTISRTEPAKAPDLYRFASRAWLAGLLDPKQVGGPKYFGNTAFKKADMVGFVKQTLVEFDKQDIEKAVMALSAEAGLKSQHDDDARQAAEIAAGKDMIASDLGCTDCHTFHGKGLSKGPNLTGYGSADWLAGIIGNPAQPRFYGKINDQMPSYAEPADDPTLTPAEIKLLAEWLRGELDGAEKK